MTRFGIGQPLRRKEDRRLLTGAGRFVADMAPAGLAHAWFVRSDVAHGDLRSVDAAAARAAPGVLAVWTAADLAGALGPLPVAARPPGSDGAPPAFPDQPLLAGDRVRFVGDTVAMVVAETEAAAQAGAELVVCDIAERPAVVDAAEALAPGAPQLWEGVPGNLCFTWEAGDAAAVRDAMAAAARKITLRAENPRVVVAALETRAATGSWDAASERFTLRCASQMPHPLRGELALLFGLPEDRFRIVIEDVGGGFGVKNSLCREQPLLLWAARALGRPVRWVGSRSDAFLTDYQGRGRATEATLALDADGRFLALEVDIVADLGAHASGRGAIPPTLNAASFSGAYRTPAIHVTARGVLTNAAPTEVYRGAGRPENLHLLERLVDAAARETGIDRVALRRRNLVSPAELPFRTPLGLTYDSGDYPAILARGMAEADWSGFAERRARALAQGRRRGVGLAVFVERCGHGVADSAELRIEADGSATVLSGAMANGQGHETALAQIAGDFLGIDPERVAVVQGDTDRVAEGQGTGGSRSIPLAGACLTEASRAVIDAAKPLAGDVLEAAAEDIAFDAGAFRIVGTDRAASWEAVARAAAARGVDLRAVGRFAPENHTYPNGCHVCEVEVDPETGAVTIERYTVAHDFGRVLNPLLLAGQVHGGVAQGLGQAGFEATVYDRSGQLLSGSFMDYCLPRADDLPAFDFTPVETACPSNPVGFKGCGEAGAAGSPPAFVNAVIDALAPCGVRHIDMPLTPERVWRALAEAENERRQDIG